MFKMMKESSKLPVHVKAWMGFMMLTFLAHAFFLGEQLLLISFLGFFGTIMLLAVPAFSLTKNILSLALVHFFFWPSILFYGLNEVFINNSIDITTLSGNVLLVGYAVFAVSLLLDTRILIGELRKSATI